MTHNIRPITNPPELPLFHDEIVFVGSLNPKRDSKTDDLWNFWRGELLMFAANLIRFSGREVNSENIRDLVSSVPQTLEKIEKLNWKQGDYGPTIETARQNVTGTIAEQDFKECERYFTATLPALAEKTRSTIISDLTSLLIDHPPLHTPLRADAQVKELV